MIEGHWLDGDAWTTALSELGPDCADVYFSPQYHALHLHEADVQLRCFEARDGDARLLVPGVRTPLPAPDESRADLQSCNGYGGPLAHPGADPRFLDAAWSAWKQAARADGIVAALFRLHPLVENQRWLPPDGVIRRERNTVYVDLDQGLEAAWQKSESRHRNMVSRARRDGCTVTWSASDGWAAFIALYRAAMERLNAPASLRFSDGYFAALQRYDATELATFSDDHGLASAAVFLWGPQHGHYHLSARRADAPNYATNFVLQAAIERAAERGLRGLHVGGGTTNDAGDPLLRFKRSVGGRLLDFHVALVVSDEEEYRDLVTRRAARGGGTPTWLLGYRQPLTG